MIVALAAAVLIVTPAMPSHAAARGACSAFADIPSPLTPTSTKSRLYAWGQIRCASDADVAVEVCAQRFTPTALITDARLVWCVHKIVKVAAGRQTYVRTTVHACTPGKAYRSSITIVGRPGDIGPFTRCRSF